MEIHAKELAATTSYFKLSMLKLCHCAHHCQATDADPLGKPNFFSTLSSSIKRMRTHCTMVRTKGDKSITTHLRVKELMHISIGNKFLLLFLLLFIPIWSYSLKANHIPLGNERVNACFKEQQVSPAPPICPPKELKHETQSHPPKE